MRSWGRRAEAWLSGLRAWQFVLVWDGSVAAGILLGVILGQFLRGRPFDPGELLGSVAGAVIASSITAFAARVKLQDRAKHGPANTDRLTR
jgi:cytochrome bd-type quinol oxidase subunit 2